MSFADVPSIRPKNSRGPLVIAIDVTEENTRRIIRTKEWNVEINEAGSGYPVFLLHGSGPGAAGWSNFAPNIGALSARYRVIALTFPGWGQSDPVVPGAEAQRITNARAVSYVMDELGIEKAALVGNSMGSVAVQQFVTDFPERVSHIVTMGAHSPGVGLMVPGGPTEGMRILAEAYRDPSPDNFRRLVRIMVFDPAFVTDELCQLRSTAALSNPVHLTNWLSPKRDGSPGGEAVVSALARTNAPALIIHGRDDRVLPLESSMRLNAIIKNSRMLIFNRCGHWAQIEHAAEFNAMVDTFLATHL